MIPNTEEMKQRLGRVLVVDSKYADLGLISLITVFCLYVLYTSLSYDPQTRAMPMLVASVTLLFILATLIKPHLIGGDRILESNQSGEFDIEEITEGRIDILRAFGWVLAILLFVYLAGIDTGTFVFLILYYRYEYGQSWKYTLGYTLLTWIPIIILFFFVLNIRIYGGVLAA